MRISTAVGLAVLCSATVLGTATAAENSFQKTGEKARFIHGDNVVTGVMPDPGTVTDVRLQTPQEKAAGLSAVMVSRDGDVYTSEIDPEDVALFEEAVRALEALGRTPAMIPGAAPTRPTVDGSDMMRPNVVIGTDDRVQITNTVAAPYWNIGRVASGCSGTLIGPKHVLTAGHCVSNGSGTWYSSLNFTPGKNGSYEPWGTTSWSNVIAPSAWHNGRDTNYDYALIILSQPAHGGWAAYGTYGGGNHTITGYPGEKPFGTMWTHSGGVWTSGSFRLCYTIDTTGGNSGSGIYDGGNVVRGVHTTGSSSQNCGTRLTSTVVNTLQNWVSQNP
ncbi:trypsin-like serine peptidase [Luteimonas abyssi]|uniref:trypsin-like serine peptidase n=1 Tax=Luteimonas abyssi TaxID=1247514 RepID=UPI000737C836|nr:trypsin-like serine protease [Luteimonas abyssi]